MVSGSFGGHDLRNSLSLVVISSSLSPTYDHHTPLQKKWQQCLTDLKTMMAGDFSFGLKMET